MDQLDPINIKERIKRIFDRMAEAALSAGRTPEELKLVAVSKRFPPEMVELAIRAGLKRFGENYVQEGEKKVLFFQNKGLDLEWHFIGHLQKNKAKQAVKAFDWIETVDSVELMKMLERHAKAFGRKISVLIQVNIAGDPAKSGLMPEEVHGFLKKIKGLGPFSFVTIKGFMTIPSFSPDPEASRPWYRALKELMERMKQGFGSDFALEELSMGMSHDYFVAIEEGATLVRVGQAIFGPRPG